VWVIKETLTKYLKGLKLSPPLNTIKNVGLIFSVLLKEENDEEVR